MTARAIRRWPLTRLPHLLGRADAHVVAIYLGLVGDLDGHIVLFLQPRTARRLIGRLFGSPGRWREDPMVDSALGEVGNITASSFLSALADQRRLDLRPTPPVVIEDLVGAILDGLLADVAGIGDTVLTIEVVLTWRESELRGTLLVLPRPPAVEGMLQVFGETDG